MVDNCDKKSSVSTAQQTHIFSWCKDSQGVSSTAMTISLKCLLLSFLVKAFSSFKIVTRIQNISSADSLNLKCVSDSEWEYCRWQHFPVMESKELSIGMEDVEGRGHVLD